MKSRRRTRKGAWVALGLIVGLVALAAIFGSKRHRGPEGPGYWYATYNQTARWARPSRQSFKVRAVPSFA